MNVCIIGAGPAGMMAAVAASRQGHPVTVYEKMNQVGKKLRLTGNGRCNMTNASDLHSFLSHIHTNQKFLYSAFHTFFHPELIRLFASVGLSVKEEDNHRIFPVTDRATDVVNACLQLMKNEHVTLHTNTPVTSLWIDKDTCLGIIDNNNQKIAYDRVIVTTGGKSVPSTGSQGDGYLFARQCHHTITPLRPGLVSVRSDHPDLPSLQGLSLQGVTVRSGKYRAKGDLLFTHNGLSGPVILNGSDQMGPSCTIDFLPDESEESLNRILLDRIEQHPNRQVGNLLSAYLPKRLIPFLLKEAGIPVDQAGHALRKEQRRKLLHVIKHLDLAISHEENWNQAMITCGGIQTDEIDPKTMASKKINHIKFAGEVLDLNADTGGFNLQIAWSTGWLAGQSLEESQ